MLIWPCITTISSDSFFTFRTDCEYKPYKHSFGHLVSFAVLYLPILLSLKLMMWNFTHWLKKNIKSAKKTGKRASFLIKTTCQFFWKISGFTEPWLYQKRFKISFLEARKISLKSASMPSMLSKSSQFPVHEPAFDSFQATNCDISCARIAPSSFEATMHRISCGNAALFPHIMGNQSAITGAYSP